MTSRERAEPVRVMRRRSVMVSVALCPAPGCLREFKPVRSDQVYCGDACRQRAHAATKTEKPNG